MTIIYNFIPNKTPSQSKKVPKKSKEPQAETGRKPQRVSPETIKRLFIALGYLKWNVRLFGLRPVVPREDIPIDDYSQQRFNKISGNDGGISTNDVIRHAAKLISLCTGNKIQGKWAIDQLFSALGYPNTQNHWVDIRRGRSVTEGELPEEKLVDEKYMKKFDEISKGDGIISANDAVLYAVELLNKLGFPKIIDLEESLKLSFR